MKRTVIASAAASLLICLSCTGPDYCELVNPKIGTAGTGHVFVGANVPFGMIQLGPTSIPNSWEFCSGYHASDSTVIGFSHTHLSGTGMSEMMDITVMPVTGKDLTYARGTESDPQSGLWSYADRSQEVCEPGYYSVPLERYGILAEMTATSRVGLERFTFPENEAAAIVFDMENGDGGVMDILTGCDIEQLSATRIQGWRKSTGWADRGWGRADNQKIYFAAEFSRPPDSFAMVDGKYGRAGFRTSQGEQILLKVAVSYHSTDGAWKNLETELPGWDFERTRAKAKAAWNRELQKLDVRTKDREAAISFYTAFYHCMIHPSLYSDCGQETLYSNFSLWDTYRAWSPLFTITHGDMYPDFMKSFLHMFDKEGQLPVWPMNGVETDCMIGNPGMIVTADAILKGIDGGRSKELYDALKSSAMSERRWQGLRREYGYIPFDLHPTQSVAYDLEYAVADAGVAKVAQMLGMPQDQEYFLTRAGWWKNHFDHETGFVRGKDSRGRWREPFNPYQIEHMADDYCEGNAWQYTWMVPHDAEGLMEAMGGREIFVENLDRLFSESSRFEGSCVSPDISGAIGQYVHGNEPSHHIVYFYSVAGEREKAAFLNSKIHRELYCAEEDGLPGNEDMGQMSAWYLLSSMGMYQVDPAGGRYWLSSPMFDRITINLPKGRKFTIRKEKGLKEKALLNGKPYNLDYIDYRDIVSGGEIILRDSE